MEENQKKKFVCKFCNRKFPCGKSLGGHIRTHMNENHSTRKEDEEEKALKFSPFNGVKKTQKDSGSEAGGQSGYGLRENPKKTWRFVDSSSTLRQEKVCKECGKGFQSLKALCGHMACHSDKEKLLINNNNNKLEEEDEEEEDEEQSETSEKQKLVMDSHSDTETSSPRKTKISKRIKYMTLDVYSSLGNGGSSSVSGIEQEQQEVAISLMMLSRDSGNGYYNKGGLNSVAESSDNNSVVLEAKSSSIEMVKKARDGIVKSAEISVSENSDSGYFRNGPKKIESDVSVDGSLRNVKFKKIEAESGSGFDKFQCVKSELGKNLVNEEEEEAANNLEGRGYSKYELRKRAKNGFYRPQIGSSCKKETNYSSSNVEFSGNSQKRNKYECMTCNKIFHSHRALGGHRASHTKTNGCCESVYESGENSIETDDYPVQTTPVVKLIENSSGKNTVKQHFYGNVERKPATKKGKEHECPICLRVFRSGQALGGHKRSHFVGGFEDKTMVVRQETPDTQISGLFDLNLPAPMEEAANGHVGFMAW
ncbi:uncharacterized protein LOC107428864 [Ziziphus jujuba]|uniref:Uncharacterized protein LOC107428864 n=2 Tax=Ziziphus jujuba TaxID=326968 RepID=A0ABM3I229_ZIZJJ|nr:uncharacterized protein LOC107428864 [Ziziphus jujuba]XP_048319015.1 uncharacterized protein LOC107428864 [Ziziphus jujuba]XP_048319016.1 uncharacterized protein LOC107428864 [Ziziphus jujuba]XP_048319017.1 uncharacterized protein LOC107428864 [Ziziphus jujuba]XP_048319018.1 uncharacterized protein LOC107428864 [Ziziphus jujuba]XP_048319019.1 uncharacterized protein LOC107428864 [Ziziphus jujuba]KAH7516063.1 hypothetical protein FEM48_Zijuj10G0095000 [Ziziphus jujuba var. spinosa]